MTSFSRFLEPRGIAIVGASSDLTRIGGQPIRLLTEFGYRGAVYPVNPKYPEIKGLACYPELAAVPRPCDLAIVALSAPHVTGVIEQCGRAGIPYALVLSAGFSEVGPEGRALQSRLAGAARAHGVRVIGPNCLGMFNLRSSVRAGFGGTLHLNTLRAGPLAMVTQSGGFGFGVAAIAAYYGVGINYAVSTGNEADVGMLELVAAFLEREDVEGVVAFMEGVTDGRQLAAVGRRALELGKPIFTWKVGNSDVGRAAAASHTARMTSGYELYRTAFAAGGFVEVRDIDDLVDAAKSFRAHRLPRGNRVGVVTLSGGAGVLLADRLVEHGLALPPFAEATAARLKDAMVSFASAANPVDATAQGYNDNFASYNQVIRTVLADPGIDAVIARAPRGKAAPVWAEGLIEVKRQSDKPLLLNWPSSPDDNAAVLNRLEDEGIPCMIAPGRAAAALAALHEFGRKRRAEAARAARCAARPIAAQRLDFPPGVATLDERRSQALLTAYGIPSVRGMLLSPSEAAALTDCPLNFPLAVKIASPDIRHKTEAGGVRLHVRDLAALRAAAGEVLEACRTRCPDARIEGVVIQEMATGVEAIAGVVNDAAFGPVVVFGLGGVFTELYEDVARRFAPFDVATAHAMIAETRAAALLAGYRGSPSLDVAALADALSRLSYLAHDHADRIAEIDVNPLMVRERGVVAADALIVLKS